MTLSGEAVAFLRLPSSVWYGVDTPLGLNVMCTVPPFLFIFRVCEEQLITMAQREMDRCLTWTGPPVFHRQSYVVLFREKLESGPYYRLLILNPDLTDLRWGLPFTLPDQSDGPLSVTLMSAPEGLYLMGAKGQPWWILLPESATSH